MKTKYFRLYSLEPSASSLNGKVKASICRQDHLTSCNILKYNTGMSMDFDNGVVLGTFWNYLTTAPHRRSAPRSGLLIGPKGLPSPLHSHDASASRGRAHNCLATRPIPATSATLTYILTCELFVLFLRQFGSPPLHHTWC